MRWIFALSMFVFLIAVLFSDYSSKVENYGFSHIGLFITAIYASTVERSDIALLTLVAAICSWYWHQKHNPIMLPVDELTSQILILYSTLSIAFERKLLNFVASVLICSLSVLYSDLIVILATSAAFLWSLYKVDLYILDIVVSTIFVIVAAWQYYTATPYSHAVWHATGAVAVAVGITARSTNKYHLLGLINSPTKTSDKSTSRCKTDKELILRY